MINRFSMDGLRQRLEYARSHVQEERRLFSEYWKVILIGLVFQYVHSVATNVAYYMHIPREPLADLGFTLIPPFTRDQQVCMAAYYQPSTYYHACYYHCSDAVVLYQMAMCIDI
jgi:hypothetical protein